MVDAAKAFATDRNHGSATTDRPNQGRAAQATAAALDAAGMRAYGRLAEAGLHAPAQHPDWVRNWAQHATADTLLALVERDNSPILALALEVVRKGPLRIARFMGGSHANGNFPAMHPHSAVTPGEIDALLAAIRRTRPDIDLLLLERLAGEIDGVANPLLCLPHAASPDHAFAASLEGGFEAVLERSGRKRKLKKHRSQLRKLEAAGGFRRLTATTPAEAKRLLSAFLAMKAAQFSRMGVADPFAPPPVVAFFAALFAEASTSARPAFVLHGLEVGGKLRAVTGSSICGKRLVCDFAAIADDELAQMSPGEFLFFENIRESCERGFAVHDFSVGDERYKRSWCDLETVQFDCFVPLTLKGRALALSMAAARRAKRAIKGNALLWNAVKRLRRGAAGPAAKDGDEE